MFDHFVEKNKPTEIVGKIFKIKWNKDKCDRRNHMFAQIGPISIAYKGYTHTHTTSRNTVSTDNKHFSQNKHTFFGITKICLFGEEEAFGK